jgi:hypothetical protein
MFSCLLLNSVKFVSAAEYEVDGKIEQALFSSDGSVRLMEESKFTVFFKDCSWLIQTKDYDTNGNVFLTRETSCLNGSEICEVCGRPDLSSATNYDVYPNLALIYSNSIPIGEDTGYFISHLWLMYASGCYFASLTTNRLTPVYDVNASVSVDPTLKREAKWELADGPGSLPLNIVYLNDYDQGTNATYTATGITNIGAIYMASGFVFERRVGSRFTSGLIIPGYSEADYRVRERSVITVTAVRPFCSRQDLLSAANGKTIVIDKRLAHAAIPIPMSTYFVRTGVQWVPIEAAKTMYVSQPLAPPKQPIAVVYLALIFMSMLPLLLFFIKRNRRQ